MADPNSAQAIDMLKKLPPERQRMVLERLTPEKRQAILQQLSATPEPAAAATSPEKPSLWQKANTGLISPQLITEITRHLPGVKAPSEAELGKAAAGDPLKSPLKNALDTFGAGVTKDIASTASSLTSPMSLATAALGPLAKAPGVAGKLAKLLLTAQGITFGTQGAEQTAEGASAGFTPEGTRKMLLGASQMAGAAPAAAEAARGVTSLLPAMSRGERAFVAALRPSPKDTPQLRQAYKYAAPELEKANIKELSDLREFSEKQRTRAASELTAKLAMRSPTSGTIDAVAVADEIRGKVTPLMKMRRNIGGWLPPEGKTIMDEADNIEQNLLKQPMTIAQAEMVVQDINAQLSKFRRLPPEAQRAAIKAGDPEAVMEAVKDSLQHQIEAKLSGYGDLKKRYGSYKELQRQAESRIDRIDAKGGDINWAEKRAMESGGMAIGALFGGKFLSKFADIMAGRVAGDVMASRLQRPSRMLRRGVNPPKPISFGGQMVQPVAAGMEQNSEEASSR